VQVTAGYMPLAPVGRDMSDFDVVVVGGGTGNNVAAAAADAGRETALVEPGPLGGTCLNRGCNPSKMVIQEANAVQAVRDAGQFHVDATLEGWDHAAVVDEMADLLGGIAEGMKERYREKECLTIFEERTRFLDERTLELGGEAVTADRVVIATGSRPLVPPIDGLAEAEYLTSREALFLREPPESLVVLGGGYIAVELGYLFESLGTTVRIVEMEDTLVPREDPDVAAAFTDVAAERHDVYTGHRVTAVESGSPAAVRARRDDGATVTVEGEALLVALGRRPNTDSLDLERAGVETDDGGFVETDAQLRTTAENVWAQGDVAGNAMFKHSGDYETEHTVANVVHDEGRAVDLSALPHAVFTEPQIAGVGATEDELAAAGTDHVVGHADLPDTAMGRAQKLDHGFAKVLAAPDGELLGAHVFGHEASVLVHEAVVAIRNGVTLPELADTIHVHPTLSKVMAGAYRDAADALDQ